MTFYVYKHYSTDGILLYVGHTKCLKSRHAAHKTTAAWHSDIGFISFDKYRLKSTARTAEWNSIWNDAPLHNKAGQQFVKSRCKSAVVALQKALR